MKKPKKVNYYNLVSRGKVRRVVTAAVGKEITPEEAAEIIEKNLKSRGSM